MRVAVSAWFWDSLTTGSGQYSRRLLEALGSIDPDLEIILVGPGPRSFGVSTRRFGSAGPAAPGPGRARTDLGKLWFEQVAFPIACRRLRADVAHVPYWAPPLVSTVPTVNTIHDLIPLLLPAYRGRWSVRAYTRLVSLTARRADLVLTDSLAARQDILKHLGLPAERVRAVHLAASGAYVLQPTSADIAVRDRLGLPDSYVLYLGGFDVRKNLRVALAAYRSAAAEIGDGYPLIVAGRLPERDTAFAPDPRRLAAEIGFDERHLRCLGWVDEQDKPALYRGARVMLFPSRYEGFGLPPLEAMACGTPVVGSNVASMVEVVGPGGLLFDPDDVEGMAGALTLLATDECVRADLSERALAHAARFSWRRTAEQTLAAYRDTMSARS